MIKKTKWMFFIMMSLFLMLNFAQNKKAMTFKDVMKFKKIMEYGLSNSGNLFYYTANPDRGDSELFLTNLSLNKEFKFDRGVKGVFSNDENWFSCQIKPQFLKLQKSKKDKPKNNLLIVNTESGDTLSQKSVNKFEFSEDSKWIAIHFNKSKKAEKTGSKFLLKRLNEKKSLEVNFVNSFSIDSLSNYLAYSVSDTAKENNGVYLVDLTKSELNPVILDTLKNGDYSNLSWSKNSKLAFTKSTFDKKNKAGKAELLFWNGNLKTLVSKTDYPQNWILPAKNKLFWSKDNNKVYFGFKPYTEVEKQESADTNDIFDYDQILAKKELDVWHWDDPLIKTNEKSEYKKKKDQIYFAVFLLNKGKYIQLSDEKMPEVYVDEDREMFLGESSVPYLKLRTWDGFFSDYYLVDGETGNRTKFAEKLYDRVNLSNDGRFVVYFKDKEWFLYNVKNQETLNLTEKIKVQFDDEDHDYPREVNSYGFGGWIDGSDNFLVYDKFDIWKFSTKNSKGVNLTKGFGRNNFLQFRIIKTDKDSKFYKSDKEVLVRAYNDKEKYTALYKLDLENNELKSLTENYKKFTFKTKAKNNDRIIYTRESYKDYPEYYITNLDFDSPKQLTNLGKQIKDYKWGTPELIEWLNADGTPLQGIVIKPENFDPNKKYPVLVYYYRFFTQRMYNFPDIVVNHRPNYGVYSSNDYVIFLPDIRFEVGYPGASAVKCLVPGVQKLVELGIADPNAIGLHGHSWSGYQTAFVVTQTDIFKCAVAGAPVSNMTSAYSGIRWGTGLARQFQYEKTQSRIGQSLFDAPHLYIENSPVFYAKRINTPLLLQHGDIDEAVPWYQSIEFYLAMRRLGKDCIFLQYRKEPHHLKKYPNKLDYSIKMKEYFDYHLKGAEPAKWITSGVPYKK